MPEIDIEAAALAQYARVTVERRHAEGDLTDAERDRLLRELDDDLALAADQAASLRRSTEARALSWWRRLLGP